jgi:transposase-like protein
VVVTFPPRSTDTRPEVTTGHQEGCRDARTTPPEFRQRAVQLAREDTTPVSKIAKDLGISDSCLLNWMHQADADENGGSDRQSSSHGCSKIMGVG